GHGACVEQDDKGWDARKRAYCLKIQPATGSFARNLIYSTKPSETIHPPPLLALLLMDLVSSGFGSIEYSATLNYIIDDNRHNLTNETKEIYIRHDIQY
ncbi:hypothetical protein, partial [Raoultella terrigena]|uniref:hypothetical protein n=1 Tax=Raoultella terrigena TaxID=577 RepID=UPI003891CE78